MKYLYGDATESPLRFNVLELLKAALDLCADMLTGVEAVAALDERSEQLRQEAATEEEHLDIVQDELAAMLDQCGEEVTAPRATGCVDAIRRDGMAQLEATRAAVKGQLQAELEQIQRATVGERKRNLARLEAFLVDHDLPEAVQWVDLKWQDDGYRARLVGMSPIKVAWVMRLDIPEDHPWAEPLRVDRVHGPLTVQVPEEAGWVRKSIKLKTYKLHKEYVVGLERRGPKTTLRLRTSTHDPDHGFDFTFDAAGLPRQGVHWAKGEAGEPFRLEDDDAAALRKLFATLRGQGDALTARRRGLESALLDGEPLAEHRLPSVLVERLVHQLAPVIQEVEARSLAPGELTLKRVLADDRREEVFVSKADLEAKIAHLCPTSRSMFGPLGLALPPPAPSLPDSSQGGLGPGLASDDGWSGSTEKLEGIDDDESLLDEETVVRDD